MDKWFIFSKTFWGIFIAFIVEIAPIMGFSFSTEDAAMVTSLIDTLVQTAALFFALYGRMKAVTSLRLFPGGG